MYICICVGMTESDIKGHIDNGFSTVSDLMYETGVTLGCGMCRLDVERIVMHEKACGFQLDSKSSILNIIKPY